MYKVVLSSIFLFTVCTSVFGQEFVFMETSLSDDRHHHWNNVHMIQISLKEYQLRPQIEFAPEYNFKTEFEQLSNKLRKAVPAGYWNTTRPGLSDSLQRIKSDEYFITWTFGKIEKDKSITYYGQLMVYFSDTSTTATVTRVVFKNANEFISPDAKKVLKLYDNYKAEQLRNPPPPLPPPIGGN